MPEVNIKPPMNESFLGYTTPEGALGYIRMDRVIRIEGREGGSAIQPLGGASFLVSETPNELIERICEAGAPDVTEPTVHA